MLSKYKNIVIKIGSSLLADENFDLRQNWLQSLCADVSTLIQQGKNVVVVSSGAVALGRKNIVKDYRKLKIEEKQAAAAIGQPALIAQYQKCFDEHNVKVAQVLLTIHDIEDRRRYLNAKNTFETLLENKIIPIVNENDTVATEELRFGDNDRLSAQVAQMIGADLLIIFSDINGLYSDDPNKNPDAKHIPVITDFTGEIFDAAKGAISKTGTGGMSTKIQAAKIAADSGCNTIITLGKTQNPINALVNGGKNSLFVASQTPLAARKAWILNRLVTSGTVVVDDGAEAALKNNKSLLAVGAKKVEGDFLRGDKIAIQNRNEQTIGYGISAYGAAELAQILGKKSSEIENIIGYTGRDAVIHIDDLVVL
jgi:glutamate 5-kinase